MSNVTSFYLPLFGACMVIGSAMELFMIKTGFYDKVTSIEADRIQEQQKLTNLNYELDASWTRRR